MPLPKPGDFGGLKGPWVLWGSLGPVGPLGTAGAGETAVVPLGSLGPVTSAEGCVLTNEGEATTSRQFTPAHPPVHASSLPVQA